MPDDAQLLRRYVEEHSEAAFRELAQHYGGRARSTVVVVPDQPVTDAGFDLEVPRRVWVLLQLLPEMSHVHPQVVGGFFRGLPPQLAQDLSVGDNLAEMGRQ